MAITIEQAAVTPLYGAKDSGCWFDNHRGIYMGDAIIETAIAHGFDCKEETAELKKQGIAMVDYEFYHELWQEAETFMDQFAGPGFWFGSNDSGDFGLWASDED